MLIEDWDDFAQRAEELYRAAPLRTRYVTKYNHRDGRLGLKVTDDVQVLQYATDQLADVKRVERLTALFLRLMSEQAPGEGAEEAMEVDEGPCSSQGGGSTARHGDAAAAVEEVASGMGVPPGGPGAPRAPQGPGRGRGRGGGRGQGRGQNHKQRKRPNG